MMQVLFLLEGNLFNYFICLLVCVLIFVAEATSFTAL